MQDSIELPVRRHGWWDAASAHCVTRCNRIHAPLCGRQPTMALEEYSCTEVHVHVHIVVNVVAGQIRFLVRQGVAPGGRRGTAQRGVVSVTQTSVLRPAIT